MAAECVQTAVVKRCELLELRELADVGEPAGKPTHAGRQSGGGSGNIRVSKEMDESRRRCRAEGMGGSERERSGSVARLCGEADAHFCVSISGPVFLFNPVYFVFLTPSGVDETVRCCVQRSARKSRHRA